MTLYRDENNCLACSCGGVALHMGSSGECRCIDCGDTSYPLFLPTLAELENDCPDCQTTNLIETADGHLVCFDCDEVIA